MKNKIEAKMVAHSVNTKGNEIATMELIFPRMILSELNTHRVFSKNSASSRAVPFPKMLRMVKEDPFIPIAWQEDHAGMQGTVYLDDSKLFSLDESLRIIDNTLDNMSEDDKGYKRTLNRLKITTDLIKNNLKDYIGVEKTLDDWWLLARDKAVEAASLLYCMGVTKQLCNRLLEPFMWHKVLLTATEFENFFDLRCPQYEIELTPDNSEVAIGNSWKELMSWSGTGGIWAGDMDTDNIVDRLQFNKGHAEIHMMALAEAMWDAINESTPQVLNPGEWHIPYSDTISSNAEDWGKIDLWGKDMLPLILKVSTARCARLSYQTFGDNPKIDYESDIRLHDSLIGPPFHASPFEHCARAMNINEYADFTRTYELLDDEHDMMGSRRVEQGWCNNFKGFIQYRYLIENGLKV